LLVYFHDIKRYFERFVSRPDTKQDYVRIFQEQYNEMEEDLRSDSDAKAELHQRVDDLRDKLWSISDERKDQAENERISIIIAHFVEDHFLIICECYVSMMQCEMDRYIQTRQIILDYARDSNQAIIDESPPKPITLPRPTVAKEENQIKLFPSSLTVKREASASKLRTVVAEPKVKRQPSTTGITNPINMGSTQNNSTSNSGSISNTSRLTHATEENPEHLLVSDFQKALDSCNSYLAALEEEKKSAAKDINKPQKVAGKGATEKPTAAALIEEKGDAFEVPQQYQAAIKVEEANLRLRLARIFDVGVEHLREVRKRALEVFCFLDECVGNSFKAEMAAIKELVLVIKQAIELEVKLPNELVLHGETFFVNYASWTFEPDPPTRPPSPVEKTRTASLFHYCGDFN
jgi:hypothetical protein